MPDHTEIDLFLDQVGSTAGWSRHTRTAYRHDLYLYADFLTDGGKKSWKESTSATLLDFFAERRRHGDHDRTLSRRRAALRTFHRHLMEEKILTTDLFAEIPPGKTMRSLPHFLTRDEVDRLFAAVEGQSPTALRDRTMIELLYASGIRATELVTMKPADLFRKKGLVEAVKVLGKRSKQRFVPLHPRIAEMLDLYLAKGRPRLVSPIGAPELFLRKNGAAMSRLQLYHRLRFLGEKAGIVQRVTPHLLRHTFATHLVHEGADLRAVQEMLGHADLSTTTIYTSVDTKRLQTIHKKFHPRG